MTPGFCTDCELDVATVDVVEGIVEEDDEVVTGEEIEEV